MQPTESIPIAAWRGKAALAVLAIWTCVGLVLNTRWSAPMHALQTTQAGSDDRSLYFKRFEKLRFSKFAESFGYVDDSPTEDWLEDHLYSTRYAIAPFGVEKGTNHEFIIGNFHPPMWMTHEMLVKRIQQSYPQLEVVADLENGVFVLKQRAQMERK